MCFARLCDCYYPGIRGHFSHVDFICARSKRNLSLKMDENEETSVNVTNDSEDSNVGEGLINCYGSPVARIAGSHRNTALPCRNFSRRFTSGEFNRFWHCMYFLMGTCM